MKYSLNNEVLLTESLSANSHHVISDSLSGMFHTLSEVLRNVYSSYARFMVNLVRFTIDCSLPADFQTTELNEFETYKQTYRINIPYCLWRRHSALFVELEEYEEYLEASTGFRPVEVTDKSAQEESGSFHINVKGVKSIPVWSSNLETIGIIHTQI